jgi:hypothetical protein
VGEHPGRVGQGREQLPHDPPARLAPPARHDQPPGQCLQPGQAQPPGPGQVPAVPPPR